MYVFLFFLINQNKITCIHLLVNDDFRKRRYWLLHTIYCFVCSVAPVSRATDMVTDSIASITIPCNRTLYKSRVPVAFNRLEGNHERNRLRLFPADENGNRTSGNKSLPWYVSTMYFLLERWSQCHDLVFRSFRYVLLTGTLTGV